MNANNDLMACRVFWRETEDDDDCGWYWVETDETGRDFGEPVGPFETAIAAGGNAREAIVRRSTAPLGAIPMSTDKYFDIAVSNAREEFGRSNDEYKAALVDLMNSLEEWKNAGAHVTTPAGAIQRFIHAVCAQREEAAHRGRMEALSLAAGSTGDTQ